MRTCPLETSPAFCARPMLPPTRPPLDEFARQPAARPLKVLSNYEIGAKFVANLQLFRIGRKGSVFTFRTRRNDPEPFAMIKPERPWRWRFFQRTRGEMCRVTGSCNLLPPDMESELWQEVLACRNEKTGTLECHRSSVLLAMIQPILHRHSILSCDEDEVCDQIRLWLEFSRSFSDATLGLLHTGYLPRQHLVLAVLLERFPELRGYATTMPLIPTLLAEKAIENDTWQEPFMKDIRDALPYGWRGLFHISGLNPDLPTLLRVKNVLLRSTPYPGSTRRSAGRNIGSYLPLLSSRKNYLGGCSPPYDEALLIHFHHFMLPGREKLQVLNQLNAVLRMEPANLGIEPLIRRTTEQVFADEAARKRYIRDLGKDCLPIISLHRMMDRKPFRERLRFDPERTPVLESQWIQARHHAFRNALSEEERFRFRPLLNCRGRESLLAELRDEFLSAGALHFLCCWNDAVLHRAIIRHPNVTLKILEWLYPIYPREVCDSPGLAFMELNGASCGISRKVVEFGNKIGVFLKDHLLLVNETDRDDNDTWVAEQINRYAESRIGNALAEGCLSIRILAARCLRVPAGCDLWMLLAEDSSWVVQAGLALNPFKPVEVTRKLAREGSLEARGILAAQPWILIAEVIDDLLQAADPTVHNALAANATLPAAQRSRLPDSCPFKWI